MVNTKNNRRSQLTHRKIQDTYLQLVTAQPDKRVKVIDLCKLAKINRATFYAHFYDVEEVASSLQKEMMASLIEILPEESENQLDVEQLITEFFTLVQANQPFFYHFFIRINAPGSINVLEDTELATLIQAVGKTQIENEDFQYRSDFFNGGLLSVTKRWLKTGCTTPISVLVHLIEEKIFKS